jgi:autophagy-related protein 9
MELPGMAADQLLLDETNIRDEHWEPPVRNLDRFFTSMYQYYVAKGLPAVILQQLSSVITLGFTIAASIFLIAFVDWANLKHCKDEKTCSENFVIQKPFEHSSVTFAFIVIIYGLLFGSFWVWKALSAIHVISSAITMERFYREKLGLRLSDLNEMEWHEVLQRLILLHEHGIHRVAIQDRLTEHDVVLRIMRKDNYMIGLINKKLLGKSELSLLSTSFFLSLGCYYYCYYL